MLLMRPRGSPPNGGLRVGDRIEGTVVKVGTDSVFIELYGKQQAFLDAAELRAVDGTMTVKEGDTIRGVVLEVDDREGYVRVGKSMGGARRTSPGSSWQRRATCPSWGRSRG